MYRTAYYAAGIVLLLAVCASTAGAQEPVSRQEMETLKQEMQEMRALVGELKSIIQQQQGVIVDLKKNAHEAEGAIADLKNDVHKVEVLAAHDGDDAGGRAVARTDHAFDDLLGSITPRISATGDFVANLGDDSHMGHDMDRFDLRGVDITFVGEIDDKARAVFNLAYHEDDISLEEAYLDVWSILPYKTDLRLGLFRANFGLLNTIHPHALTQVDYPAIYRVYLGHEGYIDEGVGLSGKIPSLWEQPFSWSLQVLNGKRHEHGHKDDGHDDDADTYKRLKDFDDIVYVARLNHGFRASERLSVNWGLSGLTGRFDEHKNSARYYLEGVDLTFNWHPFGHDDFRRLRWQTEVFFSQVKGSGDNDNAKGLYSFLDYRFKPKWSTGVRYDYAQLPLERSDHLREYSAYLTYFYSPNNRIRLQLKNSQPNFGKDINEIMLQWTFTLGRHEHIEGEEH
jgi:hypothetical protein